MELVNLYKALRRNMENSLNHRSVVKTKKDQQTKRIQSEMKDYESDLQDSKKRGQNQEQALIE